MNARLTVLALLSTALLPLAAHAADRPEIKVVVSGTQTSEYVTVRQLALETGLSERQVRMVMGPHSGYADYRLNFDRTRKQFRQALGAERYQDLLAGRPLPLYRQNAGAASGTRALAANAAVDGDTPRP